MKSHRHAGQFKLNGKKTMLLSCGCCEVGDLRERYAKKTEHKDTQSRLQDDYSYEEFMADICTPDEPCEMCRQSMERTRSNVEVTGAARLYRAASSDRRERG